MNRPRTFLHLGLHKTGTSWLQTELFPKLPNVTAYRRKNFLQMPLSHSAATTIFSHEGLSGSISGSKSPGSRMAKLQGTIDELAKLPDTDGIILGFREHRSWINAAYSQKAKKRPTDPHDYAKSFSLDELSWCKVLSVVDTAGYPVFPFAYEELLSDPQTLIRDLCFFVGTSVPTNLTEILEQRSNPSPRSNAGQKLARPFFLASQAVRTVPPLKKSLRRLGSIIGSGIDRFSAPAPVINFDDDLALVLRKDWTSIIDLISQRRGKRILSADQ